MKQTLNKMRGCRLDTSGCGQGSVAGSGVLDTDLRIPHKAICLTSRVLISFSSRILEPIPVAAPSERWDYGLSLAGVAGSNPARGKDV
jgi:hypothetical protein